jgi:sugar lactone lactonase YvrE
LFTFAAEDIRGHRLLPRRRLASVSANDPRVPGNQQVFMKNRKRIRPIILVAASFCLNTLQADDLYVINGGYGNPSIVKFNAQGQGTVFANSFANPYMVNPMGLAFDSKNNLFVVNDASSGSGYRVPIGVIEFNAQGTSHLFAPVDNGISLAFDQNGNLYVSTISSILKYDALGNGTVFASGLNFPWGMAFDKSGNLYVAMEGDGSIMKFDANGHGTLFSHNNLPTAPDAVAFDSVGNLWVATLGGEIWRFNSLGFSTRVVGPDAAVFYGLTFDSSGYLYTADYDHNVICRFDTSGKRTVFASAGIYLPTGLEVQPIPEPACLPLLTLGVGFLIPYWRRAVGRQLIAPTLAYGRKPAGGAVAVVC